MLFFYFAVFLCFFSVMILLLLKHKRTKLAYKYDAFLLGKLRLALFSICTILHFLDRASVL